MQHFFKHIINIVILEDIHQFNSLDWKCNPEAVCSAEQEAHPVCITFILSSHKFAKLLVLLYHSRVKNEI